MSWGALWEPLVCSYDISHSGTRQVTTTSLAASTVSWMVTHPSIDWAHGCLTSVIGPRMASPCQLPWLSCSMSETLMCRNVT